MKFIELIKILKLHKKSKQFKIIDMKKLFLLLIFLPFCMFSQQKRDYFTNLIEFNHPDMKSSGCFALPKSESASSLEMLNQEEMPSIPLVYPIISENQTVKFLCCYSDGPSGDPNFELYKVIKPGEYEYITSFAGEAIFFTGNGYIYTRCRSNNNFLKRQKWYFNGTTAVENKQPYYYVGLTTKTLKNIQLYSDYACKEKLAVVGANSEIEILLTEYAETNTKFLIRTPFGLCGWWIMDRDYPFSEEIEGVSFSGD